MFAVKLDNAWLLKCIRSIGNELMEFRKAYSRMIRIKIISTNSLLPKIFQLHNLIFDFNVYFLAVTSWCIKKRQNQAVES